MTDTIRADLGDSTDRPFSLFRMISAESLGVVLLVVLAILYVALDNDSFFNFWTDRDMVRSEMLFREFQWMGAELSYGSAARVPGGFLHYLWVIPTIFTKDPELSYQFCVLLGMLSLIPFYYALRTSFGATAAITATMVLLASPVLFGTLTRLWNPSFQAPFIILTFAFMVRLIAEDHTPSFKWLVASLILGLQMHMSTYLLLVCVAAALVIARVRVPLREIAIALGITVALLLPYLIGELATGWDNLRQMVSSQGKGAVRSFGLTRGTLYNPDNAGDVWRWLLLAFGMNDNLPEVPFTTLKSWLLNLAIVVGGLYTALSIAHWLEWGRPIAAALGAPCGGVRGRVLVAAAIPVIIGFVYFTYSPQVELVVYGSARYLMFAIPGLAIIAGLGMGALVAMTRNVPWAQAAVALPLLIGTAMPAWALVDSLRSLDKPFNRPGRDFMGALDQVAREMRWDLADTVARTSILRRYHPAEKLWRYEMIFGIGYELHRTGTPVPFARPGLCAAYLTGGGGIYGEKGIPKDELERSMQQPGLDVTIVRQKVLVNDLLVVYRRGNGDRNCFTTISNRYVLSDEEKVTHERYGRLKEAAAEPVTRTIPPGAKGFMVNMGQGVYGLIKLRPEGGRLIVELHSNQLRGDTYNGGFLDAGLIADPRLRFDPASGTAFAVPIERGLVGGKGTFTPIRLQTEIPPGTYAVTFEADVYPPVKLGTWPVDFAAKRAVRIPLTSGYNVAK